MRRLAALLGLGTALAAAAPAAAAAPLVKVSENRRFLVFDDGRPFFWLGDTAWELFHRLTREEAALYLEDRAGKGFTVIQAVALAELDGLHDPNPYEHRPLVDDDPARPDVKEGAGNDYWDHVDFIVQKAEALGLFIGFLPTWGDKWNRPRGQGAGIFDAPAAEAYGEWLGKRYRERPLFWILGGDRAVENDAHREILRAMARGLRRGDGGRHLITFHPPGGHGSSTWLHDEEWLDFNMRQNGHVPEFGRYAQTRADYDRSPVKPVVDGEPLYEDHPVAFNARELGHSTAADVRRPLYWDLFSGAFGHTYGHHSVWQMAAPGRQPVNGPLLPWTEAIHQPGAAQMRHARRLLESRPFLTRVPDDTVIVPHEVPTAVPGAGQRRFAATRDAARTYVMVYAPVARPFRVRLDAVQSPVVKAWWFDPRTGEAAAIGELPAAPAYRFEPPGAGEMMDWVLVLDDPSRGYPLPGAAVKEVR